MAKIRKSELDDYRRLMELERTGHVLSTDCLRFICAAYQYDPEKIGRYWLHMLAEWRSKENEAN